MTVAEMIRFLQTLDPDMQVYIGNESPYKLNIVDLNVTNEIFDSRTEDADILVIEVEY